MSCCNNPPYYMTAYGLAVKHGYQGTEEQWLKSLNAYLHITFSHHLPQSNADLHSAPDAWIGIATTKSEIPPEDYTDYSWLYVKGEADSQILAPAYNEQMSYTAGSVVSFGQAVYRATTDISIPEAFNPAHWEYITLANLIEEAGNVPEGAVSTDKLTDNAVTSDKINNGAVGTSKIAESAVTTAKIANGAVTTEKIGEEAVGTTNIQNVSVTTAKLADKSVTTAKLADAAVTTEKIGSKAVTGAKMNLSNGDLPTIKLTKGIHYYDSQSQAPTTAGVLSFIKSTE